MIDMGVSIQADGTVVVKANVVALQSGVKFQIANADQPDRSIHQPAVNELQIRHDSDTSDRGIRNDAHVSRQCCQ